MKLREGDPVIVFGAKARLISTSSDPEHPKKKQFSLHKNEPQSIHKHPKWLVEFDNKMRGTTDANTEHGKPFGFRPGYSLWVLPQYVLPYEDKVLASIMIQCAYRRYLARKNFAKLIAFKFWNELECIEEKDTLSNNRNVGSPVLNTLKKRISDEEYYNIEIEDSESDYSGSDQEGPKGFFRKSLLQDVSDHSYFSELTISPSYLGPHLKWPIKKQFAFELMNYFRDYTQMLFPQLYAYQILIQVEELLKYTITSSVHYITIPDHSKAKLILVGDTHGQINDVLWLFYKFGPPSPTNIYVFNGDIADRGKFAVEIFLMLFSFMLIYPNSVIINRGNHESSDMNEVYGFAKEVRKKYSGAMYRKFHDIFGQLPLCVVIQKRVIVVHGGLFRKDNVTLSSLSKINRNRACPTNPVTYEDVCMFDILWSDPRSEAGRGLSTRGSDCICFGPDVTENFLKLNKLEVCIRSHQVPSNLRGFEPLHDGRCVTLFSASNYCGTTGNYGGVVIFEADMSFEIQEYMAPSLEVLRKLHIEMKRAMQKVLTQNRIQELETMAKTQIVKSSTTKMLEDIHTKLTRLLCEHKEELWSIFNKLDDLNTGYIKKSQWRQVCDDVIGGHLPWFFFMQFLGVSDDVLVNYNQFLQRFRIDFSNAQNLHKNWREECVTQLYESILKADLSIKETQMIIDRNCDGAVSLQDFIALLTDLRVGLSEPQIKILMRIITANCPMQGDKVDIAVFLGRIKVIYSNEVLPGDADQDWIRSALQCIGKALVSDKLETARRYYEDQPTTQGGAENVLDINNTRRRSSALRAVALFQKFRDFDTSGEGFLSYEDFGNAISQLPMKQIASDLGFKLTHTNLMDIARAIDTTGSLKINYFEFLSAFHIVDGNTKASIAEELWNHICTVLYQHQTALRTGLRQYDPQFTGKINLMHFRSSLTTLNAVLAYTSSPLTEDQIDSLVTFIDLDVDGMFDYEDFLESFQPVDLAWKSIKLGRLKGKIDIKADTHKYTGPILTTRRKAFLNQYQFHR